MRPTLTPQNIKLALLALCLQLSLPVQALESDQNQPINLESDTADIDDTKGTSIYKGNVKVTQGSIHVTGDTVTLFSPGRKLDKIRVEGNPARYSQRPDDADKDIRAEGRTIEYYVNTDKLLLQEEAHVWNENGDQISGSRIEYDLKADIGKATSNKTDKQRVRVIIEPTKGNSDATKPGTGRQSTTLPSSTADSAAADGSLSKSNSSTP